MDGLGIVNDAPLRQDGLGADEGSGGGGGGGGATTCERTGGWITRARGAGFTGILVHIFGFWSLNKAKPPTDHFTSVNFA